MLGSFTSSDQWMQCNLVEGKEEVPAWMKLSTLCSVVLCGQEARLRSAGTCNTPAWGCSDPDNASFSSGRPSIHLLTQAGLALLDPLCVRAYRLV